MAIANLEHVNLTVRDPKKTAALLIELFGWHIRWEGPAMNNGYTVHVGTNETYVALYRPAEDRVLPRNPSGRADECVGALNHIAVVVGDIDAMEAEIIAAGYVPENHGDYEPGRRFYFYDGDGIEYEVVSYS